VLECFFNSDTLAGVECQHAVEQVQSIGVCAREELVERNLGHVGQVADVFLGTWGSDTGESRFRRRTEEVKNLVELVDVIATLEEGFAAEELGEDAADGPDVDLSRVLVMRIDLIDDLHENLLALV
jgi:hypothetical protein